MSKQKGMERVKRVICNDCGKSCGLHKEMCGDILELGISDHNQELRGYMEKRFKAKNGCREFSLLHFTFKRHKYRPGFMHLKEEGNGEMWVYYDHDAEQTYDKSYHRSGWLTDHDRSVGGGSKFGYQGSGGLKGSGSGGASIYD